MAVTPSATAVVTSIAATATVTVAASVTSIAATVTSVTSVAATVTPVIPTVTPVISIAPVAESKAEERVAIVPAIIRPVVIGAVTVIGVCRRWIGGNINR